MTDSLITEEMLVIDAKQIENYIEKIFQLCKMCRKKDWKEICQNISKQLTFDYKVMGNLFSAFFTFY